MKSDVRPPLRLLKKSQIAHVLNISAIEFERKLGAGIIPQPCTWLSETPRGRRWHPEDISSCFGVAVEA